MATNEITERKAAEVLGMNSETLRYQRIAGWLAEGICREADKPPMQVRPNIRYDLDKLTELVEGDRTIEMYRAAQPA